MKSNLLFVLAIVGIVFVGGCVQQAGQKTVNANPNSESTIQAMKGVSLSPRSFQQNDFIDFFNKASQAGKAVMWAGDWNELSKTESGGPVVVASLASTYGYIPIIELQFFTQSDGKLLRPLDESTKQDYKDSAAAFAKKYKPKYMGLGIEINTLYEKSPGDFDAFSSFYSEVYDAIKKESPNTMVFTVFQLEKMKGLNGGLFGGTNDQSKSQWSLLDRFSKSDIIAFTTYPGLVYKTPAEIPPDYYLEIKSHTTKPIAFTEVGWHSAASPKGWESSDVEQAEFVAIFFSLTKGLGIKLAVWSFLYDQNTIEPFNSMGLLRSDGSSKPAWNVWTNVK